MLRERQIFGDTTCHPERSEGSSATDAEMLRPFTHSLRSGQASFRTSFAQHDIQDTSHIRSRNVLSPSVCKRGGKVQILREEKPEHPQGVPLHWIEQQGRLTSGVAGLAVWITIIAPATNRIALKGSNRNKAEIAQFAAWRYCNVCTVIV